MYPFFFPWKSLTVACNFYEKKQKGCKSKSHLPLLIHGSFIWFCCCCLGLEFLFSKTYKNLREEKEILGLRNIRKLGDFRNCGEVWFYKKFMYCNRIKIYYLLIEKQNKYAITLLNESSWSLSRKALSYVVTWNVKLQ